MIMQYTNETRSIIILVCTYIYDNVPKINLLLTCKFIYNLRKNISLYQQVNFNHSRRYNNMMLYTNIYTNITNYFETKPEELSNVRELTISEGLLLYAPQKLKISYIPKNNLKILKILDMHEVTADCILPKTLHTLKLCLSKSITDNFFPENLKKLSVGGHFTYRTDLNFLFPNLTYLKFLTRPNLDFILYKLPPNLKCLILKYVEYQSAYNNNTILNMLPNNIKHFALGKSFRNFSFDQMKRIIPKNIRHLDIDDNIFYDVSCDYPSLTKISIKCGGDNFVIEKLLWIPSITSLCVRNYKDQIIKYIPSHIIKLKLKEMYTASMLPNTIQELYIGNLKKNSNKLFCTGSNIKKLTIKYNDKYLLDPSVYDTCKVIFKY